VPAAWAERAETSLPLAGSEERRPSSCPRALGASQASSLAGAQDIPPLTTRLVPGALGGPEGDALGSRPRPHVAGATRAVPSAARVPLVRQRHLTSTGTRRCAGFGRAAIARREKHFLSNDACCKPSWPPRCATTTPRPAVRRGRPAPLPGKPHRPRAQFFNRGKLRFMTRSGSARTMQALRIPAVSPPLTLLYATHGAGALRRSSPIRRWPWDRRIRSPICAHGASTRGSRGGAERPPALAPFSRARRYCAALARLRELVDRLARCVPPPAAAPRRPPPRAASAASLRAAPRDSSRAAVVSAYR
jgi:hypothetical protein